MRSRTALPRQGRVMLGALTLALSAVLAGLTIQATQSEDRAVAEVEDRFGDRIDLAASYIATHLDDIRSLHGDEATLSDRTVLTLTELLRATSTLHGRELYLVDQHDEIVASTIPPAEDGVTVPAALSEAPDERSHLMYSGEPHFVVTVPIDNTNWRLIAAVPEGVLHEPVRGIADTFWILVGGSAAMAAVTIALLAWVLRQREDLRRASRTDRLTGLANRGRADEMMTRAGAISERTRGPWSIAMLDIDHFKAVNDRLGHAAGDRVLECVAAVIDREVRTSDFCARWGGEEFVVILEDTELADAVVVCERIRVAIGECTAGEAPVTISIGVATMTGDNIDHLLRRADDALYEAKRSGRNQVIAAPVLTGSAVEPVDPQPTR